MSYTKYKTKGIIVGGSNVGEASRNYNIFTQDFGLIRVRAQGIRELNSKLKFHLQNLFLTDLSLIKGKGGWRVTEAYKIKSLPQSFDTNFKVKSSTRILFFLKRMLSEENENRLLFDIILKGFDFMERENLSDDSVSDLETLIVLRALRELGYIKGDRQLDNLLGDDNYNDSLLEQTNKSKSFVINEINQSIKASEL